MAGLFGDAVWLNEPKVAVVDAGRVEMTTEPETDYWQRSYYGFRNMNAPALLIERADNFSFSARVRFAYKNQYDQCGLVIYLDDENWFKASIEFENEVFSRLGSVVTNGGYSDWATQDISTPQEIWYRLSRRGPDFLIESSKDGQTYQQMRVFHLRNLGETSEEMGRLDPLPADGVPVRFGLYACSPTQSSFHVTFDEFKLTECVWKSHFVSH